MKNNILGITKETREFLGWTFKKGELQLPTPLDIDIETIYTNHKSIDWNHLEIGLVTDKIDYENETEDEKDIFIKTFLLFVQSEIIVASKGYASFNEKVGNINLQILFTGFQEREGVHYYAYRRILDELGFDNDIFKKFLKIDILNKKATYLNNFAKNKEHIESIDKDEKFLEEFLYELLVYGGGLEAISLMTSFAIMLSYKNVNKFQGSQTVVNYSLADEMYHFKSNAFIFRSIVNTLENGLSKSTIEKMNKIVDKLVKYEIDTVDYINPTHIDKQDIKEFIYFCGNRVKYEFNLKKFTNEPQNPLEIIEQTLGSKQQDFFNNKVTEYAKRKEPLNVDNFKEAIKKRINND